MGLTIRALDVGRLVGLPKPAITYLHGWGETYDPAMIMFLIEGGEHPVLVDSGTSEPDFVARYHHYQLERTRDQEPLNALRDAGYAPEDIGTVINTHLHWDHCSNNHLFTEASIVLQKRELEYAVDPLELSRVAYERTPGITPPWFKVWNQLQTVEGEAEIIPGVTVVPLPGHTPGSQGVLVEADSGRYLLAGDCVDTYENWTGSERASHIPSGLFTDLVAYTQSFQRIESLGCEVVPSHDEAVLDQATFK